MSKAKPTAELSIVPAQAQLAELSVEQLRAELARGITSTAQHLTRLAAVWTELEGRGEDLSDLRVGLARMLPLIASGRLASEAVVAFAGRPMLLRGLEGVALDEQRRLAAGGTIEVIDPAAAEGHSTITLAQLPSAAIRLVFADGEVRTPQAQRLALRPRRRPQKEDEPGRRYLPKVDRAAGVVRIGRMEVRLDDLLEALAASAGPELPVILHPEEYRTVKVRLTPEELEKLAATARQAELPDWEMVRKALRTVGLI